VLVVRQSVDHEVFTDGQIQDSSFLRVNVHPEIREGSPRARALNDEGSTEVAISDFKFPYLRNSAE